MEWTLLPAAFLVFWYLYRRSRNLSGHGATRARDEQIVSALQPIYDALDQNVQPDASAVAQLAELVEVRAMLYRLLEQSGHLHLFPERWANYEAAAESDLAFWLLHPAELGAVPEDLSYLQPIVKYWDFRGDQLQLTYHLLQFTHKSGEVVVGIAGPVIGDDPPYTPARCTYTYYDPVDSATPEEHVAKLHDSQWPQVAKRLFGEQ